MYHNSVAVLAVSKDENPTVFQKTLGLNDFYHGTKDFDYPVGNIQMVGKSQGPMYKGEKPIEAGLAPMFSLDDVAKHAVDFWLSTEDLPMPDNRVTIERDGNIKLSYTPNNQVAKQKLYNTLKSMLGDLGMHSEHLIPPEPVHEERDRGWRRGSPGRDCRFGTDPKSSVLDSNCKAHELDNLYVVDTSFFPSIGAVNPALTASPWRTPFAWETGCSAPRGARRLNKTPPAKAGKGERVGTAACRDPRRRGFAGLGAMKALKAPVRVTLVDQNDYHTSNSLPYQLATAELSETEVAFPARDLLHGRDTAFHRARVTALDLDARRVVGGGWTYLEDDYLVVALGAVVKYFGTSGAPETRFRSTRSRTPSGSSAHAEQFEGGRPRSHARRRWGANVLRGGWRGDGRRDGGALSEVAPPGA